tara:strand:+ start:2160 stop:3602 length:1443 start_codon:yes stop_codon:yes gene_type:complete
MNLNVIVAYCNKNGIGNENTIPWKLKDDLKNFKNITTNGVGKNIVIMGRNTWESIPDSFRPLMNRYNFVLSSKKEFVDSDKVDFISSSFDNMIKYIECEKNLFSNSKIFIIGGEMLYKYIMDKYLSEISALYVTEIYSEIECDRVFPKIDANIFKIKDVSKFKKENELNFRYFTYEKQTNNTDFYINKEELDYKNMIKNILDTGLKRDDRTGVGTISVFAPLSMKYNLEDTFPLCTLKRGFFRAVFEELILYIRGQTDNNILKEKNIHIWDGNTTREFLDKRGLTELPEGDMGETYGFNMRHYGGKYINCKTNYEKDNGFDQLNYVINEIKHNPHSRRILINLWNPKTTQNAALPSCLHQYQFFVDTEKKTLSVQIYLRSSDVFLANNWNVCTGALFVYLLCNLTDIDLKPGELTMVCGDAHIYKNHIELAEKMIERSSYPYPKLIILNKKNNIEDFMYEDIKLIGYKSHPNDLKGEMAV